MLLDILVMTMLWRSRDQKKKKKKGENAIKFETVEPPLKYLRLITVIFFVCGEPKSFDSEGGLKWIVIRGQLRVSTLNKLYRFIFRGNRASVLKF